MYLSGGKLICLNHKSGDGEESKEVTITAWGPKLSIGYYMSCDYVLYDKRAEGVHCEIKCDAVTGVCIYNNSIKYPITVDGSLVVSARPLMHNSKITILDRHFIWVFPEYTCNDAEQILEESTDATSAEPALNTVNSTAGYHTPPLCKKNMPNQYIQKAMSCPETKKYREVLRRFTVHKFTYCIKSDDAMENSLLLKRDCTTKDVKTNDNTTTEKCNNNNAEAAVVHMSSDIISKERGNHNIEIEETNAEVSQQEIEGEKVKAETKVEIEVRVIDRTKNTENTNTPGKEQLLSLCKASNMVVTSYSPREVGVRVQKSFTKLVKPKILTVGSNNTPTTNTLEQTPIIRYFDCGDDDGDDAKVEQSRYLINFTTPTTSARMTPLLMTKQSENNTSMHIIDLTITPQKHLTDYGDGRVGFSKKPITPLINSTKKNLVNYKSLLNDKLLLGVSKLPSTPVSTSPNDLDASKDNVSTDTIFSVSSTDSLTSMLSNKSAVPLTISMQTSANTIQETPNKTQPNSIQKSTVQKRTPLPSSLSLRKKILLSGTKKQIDNVSMNLTKTTKGITATTSTATINTNTSGKNFSGVIKTGITSTSKHQSMITTSKDKSVTTAIGKTLITPNSNKCVSKYLNSTKTSTVSAVPSSSSRVATAITVTPIPSSRFVTSTPYVTKYSQRKQQKQQQQRKSPTHRVLRKSFKPKPNVSRISKAKAQVMTSTKKATQAATAATAMAAKRATTNQNQKFKLNSSNSLKQKSPELRLTSRLVSKARKSLCSETTTCSPALFKRTLINTTGPSSLSLSELTKKTNANNEMNKNDDNVFDKSSELSRTFIIESTLDRQDNRNDEKVKSGDCDISKSYNSTNRTMIESIKQINQDFTNDLRQKGELEKCFAEISDKNAATLGEEHEKSIKVKATKTLDYTKAKVIQSFKLIKLDDKIGFGEESSILNSESNSPETIHNEEDNEKPCVIFSTSMTDIKYNKHLNILQTNQNEEDDDDDIDDELLDDIKVLQKTDSFQEADDWGDVDYAEELNKLPPLDCENNVKMENAKKKDVKQIIQNKKAFESTCPPPLNVHEIKVGDKGGSSTHVQQNQYNQNANISVPLPKITLEEPLNVVNVNIEPLTSHSKLENINKPEYENANNDGKDNTLHTEVKFEEQKVEETAIAVNNVHSQVPKKPLEDINKEKGLMAHINEISDDKSHENKSVYNRRQEETPSCAVILQIQSPNICNQEEKLLNSEENSKLYKSKQDDSKVHRSFVDESVISKLLQEIDEIENDLSNCCVLPLKLGQCLKFTSEGGSQEKVENFFSRGKEIPRETSCEDIQSATLHYGKNKEVQEEEKFEFEVDINQLKNTEFQKYIALHKERQEESYVSFNEQTSKICELENELQSNEAQNYSVKCNVEQNDSSGGGEWYAEGPGISKVLADRNKIENGVNQLKSDQLKHEGKDHDVKSILKDANKFQKGIASSSSRGAQILQKECKTGMPDEYTPSATLQQDKNKEDGAANTVKESNDLEENNENSSSRGAEILQRECKTKMPDEYTPSATLQQDKNKEDQLNCKGAGDGADYTVEETNDLEENIESSSSRGVEILQRECRTKTPGEYTLSATLQQDKNKEDQLNSEGEDGRVDNILKEANDLEEKIENFSSKRTKTLQKECEPKMPGYYIPSATLQHDKNKEDKRNNKDEDGNVNNTVQEISELQEKIEKLRETEILQKECETEMPDTPSATLQQDKNNEDQLNSKGAGDGADNTVKETNDLEENIESSSSRGVEILQRECRTKTPGEYTLSATLQQDKNKEDQLNSEGEDGRVDNILKEANDLEEKIENFSSKRTNSLQKECEPKMPGYYIPSATLQHDKNKEDKRNNKDEDDSVNNTVQEIIELPEKNENLKETEILKKECETEMPDTPSATLQQDKNNEDQLNSKGAGDGADNSVNETNDLEENIGNSSLRGVEILQRECTTKMPDEYTPSATLQQGKNKEDQLNNKGKYGSADNILRETTDQLQEESEISFSREVKILQKECKTKMPVENILSATLKRDNNKEDHLNIEGEDGVVFNILKESYEFQEKIKNSSLKKEILQNERKTIMSCENIQSVALRHEKNKEGEQILLNVIDEHTPILEYNFIIDEGATKEHEKEIKFDEIEKSKLHEICEKLTQKKVRRHSSCSRLFITQKNDEKQFPQAPNTHRHSSADIFALSTSTPLKQELIESGGMLLIQQQQKSQKEGSTKFDKFSDCKKTSNENLHFPLRRSSRRTSLSTEVSNEGNNCTEAITRRAISVTLLTSTPLVNTPPPKMKGINMKRLDFSERNEVSMGIILEEKDESDEDGAQEQYQQGHWLNQPQKQQMPSEIEKEMSDVKSTVPEISLSVLSTDKSQLNTQSFNMDKQLQQSVTPRRRSRRASASTDYCYMCSPTPKTNNLTRRSSCTSLTSSSTTPSRNTKKRKTPLKRSSFLNANASSKTPNRLDDDQQDHSSIIITAPTLRSSRRSASVPVDNSAVHSSTKKLTGRLTSLSCRTMDCDEMVNVTTRRQSRSYNIYGQTPNRRLEFNVMPEVLDENMGMIIEAQQQLQQQQPEQPHNNTSCGVLNELESLKKNLLPVMAEKNNIEEEILCDVINETVEGMNETPPKLKSSPKTDNDKLVNINDKETVNVFDDELNERGFITTEKYTCEKSLCVEEPQAALLNAKQSVGIVNNNEYEYGQEIEGNETMDNCDYDERNKVRELLKSRDEEMLPSVGCVKAYTTDSDGIETKISYQPDSIAVFDELPNTSNITNTSTSEVADNSPKSNVQIVTGNINDVDKQLERVLKTSRAKNIIISPITPAWSANKNQKDESKVLFATKTTEYDELIFTDYGAESPQLNELFKTPGLLRYVVEKEEEKKESEDENTCTKVNEKNKESKGHETNKKMVIDDKGILLDVNKSIEESFGELIYDQDADKVSRSLKSPVVKVLQEQQQQQEKSFLSDIVQSSKNHKQQVSLNYSEIADLSGIQPLNESEERIFDCPLRVSDDEIVQNENNVSAVLTSNDNVAALKNITEDFGGEIDMKQPIGVKKNEVDSLLSEEGHQNKKMEKIDILESIELPEFSKSENKNSYLDDVPKGVTDDNKLTESESSDQMQAFEPSELEFVNEKGRTNEQTIKGDHYDVMQDPKTSKSGVNVDLLPIEKSQQNEEAEKIETLEFIDLSCTSADDNKYSHLEVSQEKLDGIELINDALFDQKQPSTIELQSFNVKENITEQAILVNLCNAIEDPRTPKSSMNTDSLTTETIQQNEDVEETATLEIINLPAKKRKHSLLNEENLTKDKYVERKQACESKLESFNVKESMNVQAVEVEHSDMIEDLKTPKSKIAGYSLITESNQKNEGAKGFEILKSIGFSDSSESENEDSYSGAVPKKMPDEDKLMKDQLIDHKQISKIESKSFIIKEDPTGQLIVDVDYFVDVEDRKTPKFGTNTEFLTSEQSRQNECTEKIVNLQSTDSPETESKKSILEEDPLFILDEGKLMMEDFENQKQSNFKSKLFDINENANEKITSVEYPDVIQHSKTVQSTLKDSLVNERSQRNVATESVEVIDLLDFRENEDYDLEEVSKEIVDEENFVKGEFTTEKQISKTELESVNMKKSINVQTVLVDQSVVIEDPKTPKSRIKIESLTTDNSQQNEDTEKTLTLRTIDLPEKKSLCSLLEENSQEMLDEAKLTKDDFVGQEQVFSNSKSELFDLKESTNKQIIEVEHSDIIDHFNDIERASKEILHEDNLVQDEFIYQKQTFKTELESFDVKENANGQIAAVNQSDEIESKSRIKVNVLPIEKSAQIEKTEEIGTFEFIDMSDSPESENEYLEELPREKLDEDNSIKSVFIGEEQTSETEFKSRNVEEEQAGHIIVDDSVVVEDSKTSKSIIKVDLLTTEKNQQNEDVEKALITDSPEKESKYSVSEEIPKETLEGNKVMKEDELVGQTQALNFKSLLLDLKQNTNEQIIEVERSKVLGYPKVPVNIGSDIMMQENVNKSEQKEKCTNDFTEKFQTVEETEDAEVNLGCITDQVLTNTSTYLRGEINADIPVNELSSGGDNENSKNVSTEDSISNDIVKGRDSLESCNMEEQNEIKGAKAGLSVDLTKLHTQISNSSCFIKEDLTNVKAKENLKTKKNVMEQDEKSDSLLSESTKYVLIESNNISHNKAFAVESGETLSAEQFFKRKSSLHNVEISNDIRVNDSVDKQAKLDCTPIITKETFEIVVQKQEIETEPIRMQDSTILVEDDADVKNERNYVNVTSNVDNSTSILEANNELRNSEDTITYNYEVNVSDAVKSNVGHIAEQTEQGRTRTGRRRYKESKADNSNNVMADIPLKRSTRRQNQSESKLQTADQQPVIKRTCRKVTKFNSNGESEDNNEENNHRMRRKQLKKSLIETIVERDDDMAQTKESSSKNANITQISHLVESCDVETVPKIYLESLSAMDQQHLSSDQKDNVSNKMKETSSASMIVSQQSVETIPSCFVSEIEEQKPLKKRAIPLKIIAEDHPNQSITQETVEDLLHKKQSDVTSSTKGASQMYKEEPVKKDNYLLPSSDIKQAYDSENQNDSENAAQILKKKVTRKKAQHIVESVQGGQPRRNTRRQQNQIDHISLPVEPNGETILESKKTDDLNQTESNRSDPKIISYNRIIEKRNSNEPRDEKLTVISPSKRRVNKRKKEKILHEQEMAEVIQKLEKLESRSLESEEVFCNKGSSGATEIEEKKCKEAYVEKDVPSISVAIQPADHDQNSVLEGNISLKESNHKPNDITSNSNILKESTVIKEESQYKNVIASPDDLANSTLDKVKTSPMSANQSKRPQRKVATAYHNYDETSDSDVAPVIGKRKSVERPLQSVSVENDLTIKSSTPLSISGTIVTARGRVRRPTARVQQFLEEKRAKGESPRRSKMARKASRIETTIAVGAPRIIEKIEGNSSVSLESNQLKFLPEKASENMYQNESVDYTPFAVDSKEKAESAVELNQLLSTFSTSMFQYGHNCNKEEISQNASSVVLQLEKPNKSLPPEGKIKETFEAPQLLKTQRRRRKVIHVNKEVEEPSQKKSPGEVQFYKQTDTLSLRKEETEEALKPLELLEVPTTSKSRHQSKATHLSKELKETLQKKSEVLQWENQARTISISEKSIGETFKPYELLQTPTIRKSRRGGRVIYLEKELEESSLKKYEVVQCDEVAMAQPEFEESIEKIFKPFKLLEAPTISASQSGKAAHLNKELEEPLQRKSAGLQRGKQEVLPESEESIKDIFKPFELLEPPAVIKSRRVRKAKTEKSSKKKSPAVLQLEKQEVLPVFEEKEEDTLEPNAFLAPTAVNKPRRCRKAKLEGPLQKEEALPVPEGNVEQTKALPDLLSTHCATTNKQRRVRKATHLNEELEELPLKKSPAVKELEKATDGQLVLEERVKEIVKPQEYSSTFAVVPTTTKVRRTRKVKKLNEELKKQSQKNFPEILQLQKQEGVVLVEEGGNPVELLDKSATYTAKMAINFEGQHITDGEETKTPAVLQIKKQKEEMLTSTHPTSIRSAGKRTAAAAAKVRIEEDAIAAAAIDPPKKIKGRKGSNKTTLPIECDETNIQSSSSASIHTVNIVKRVTRLASASTITSNEDLMDLAEETTNESLKKADKSPRPKRNNRKAADAPTTVVPAKRARRVKGVVEKTDEENQNVLEDGGEEDVELKAATSSSTTRTSRNRKVVQFKSSNKNNIVAVDAGAPQTMEAAITASQSESHLTSLNANVDRKDATLITTQTEVDTTPATVKTIRRATRSRRK